MKILAIGGCGSMGRYAMRASQHYNSIDKIIIADIDIEAAERAEMKSIFLLSGQGESYLEDVKRDHKPNLIAKDLLHAAKEVTSI